MLTIAGDAGPSTLRLGGELDLAESERVIERATQAIPPRGDLVLDLEEVSFIDSSGAAALVVVAGRLPVGGHLILRAPTSQVRRVLDLLRIEEIAAIRIDARRGTPTAA